MVQAARKQPLASFHDLQLLFAEATACEEETPPGGQGPSGGGAPVDAPTGAESPQHHSLQPPRDSSSLEHPRGSLGVARPLSRDCSMRGGYARSSSGGSVRGGTAAGTALQQPQRRPPQQYGERVAERLRRRCSEARGMLEAMQAPLPGAKPRLPSMALRFCKALAFVQQHKAGLVAGCTWGNGLLIQRLPDGTWSAPLFLRLRFASLGLTMGAQAIRAVYVLQTEEQVAGFIRGSGTVTVDAAMPGELDPLDVYAPIKPIKHRDLSVRPNTVKPQCATVSEGLIWDFSLRAGFTRLDRGLNGQLYGEGSAPEEVLAGGVAPPPELVPLYLDIEGRAAEAQVVRHTVSKFEQARLRAAQHLDWSNRGGERSTRGGERSVRSGRALTHDASQRSSSSSIGVGVAQEGTLRGGLPRTPSPSSGDSGLLAGSLTADSPCATLAAHGSGTGSHGFGGPDLGHGSASGGDGGGAFKLFGEVDIGFEPTPVEEEEVTEAQAGGARP